MKFLTFLFFFPLLVSCSNDSESEKCFLGIDQVHVIDSLKTEDNTYFLVHRLTGFQEKVEYLELYDSEPTFDDQCRRGSIDPIYVNSFDESGMAKYVYLNINQHTFTIIYDDDTSSSSSLAENRALKLELKSY